MLGVVCFCTLAVFVRTAFVSISRVCDCTLCFECKHCCLSTYYCLNRIIIDKLYTCNKSCVLL